jgi:hypothetical protein
MGIASKALGITAWQARVSIGKDSEPYFRMFFHLDGFVADTNFAQHIAGAVLLTAELFYGPLIMRGEEGLVFQLPRDGYLSRRKIYSASQLARRRYRAWDDPRVAQFSRSGNQLLLVYCC